MVIGPTNIIFAPLSTLASHSRLASLDLPWRNRQFSPVDEDERTAETPSSQMNQVVSAINSPLAILQSNVTQIKVLHTQVPKFIGSKDKSIEFEHLLLNHLLPHQHKITEENKLHYFPSLLRDEVVVFRQTLRISTKTTPRNVLIKFQKKWSRRFQKSLSTNGTN